MHHKYFFYLIFNQYLNPETMTPHITTLFLPVVNFFQNMLDVKCKQRSVLFIKQTLKSASSTTVPKGFYFNHTHVIVCISSAQNKHHSSSITFVWLYKLHNSHNASVTVTCNPLQYMYKVENKVYLYYDTPVCLKCLGGTVCVDALYQMKQKL